MSTDSVKRYDANPDPYFEGCRNSGRIEEGVVFQNVEPMEGVFTYIGKTALTEAFAEMYGMKPDTLQAHLEENNAKQLRAMIHKLEDEKALLAERIAMINKLMLEDLKHDEADSHDSGRVTGEEGSVEEGS